MSPFRLALAALALATACATPHPVKEVSVDEVARALEAGTVTVLDANDDEYRAYAGTLPGAVRLSSFSGYDVSATLPADKSRPLVFYCTSRL